MSDEITRHSVAFDWAALKESKAAQIDQWSALLGVFEPHPDIEGHSMPPVREMRSDTARVQAQRHLQRCEDDLDRLDMLEAISTQLTDDIEVARARADLAALEGSHGPAIQWTRLAHELGEKRRVREQEARAAAAANGQPDTEIGRLAQTLLAAPQAVREELARVMLAGRVPDDWRPSELIRLDVGE